MSEPAAGNVLVLGSGGFIGSAITESLARTRRRVHAMGRSEVTTDAPNVLRVRGSIEDTALLHESIASCEHIVYCASVTTPGTSAGDPTLEVLGNLLPLARVLECAADFPKRRLVFLSSGGTVYGDGGRGAVETTPLQPRSYYGAGKAAAEAMIHACVASSDWQATVLRPSNVYGPGQDLAKGFAIVPTLLARALDGLPFQVWGDGTAVRDYCFIDDLVEAAGAVLAAPQIRPFATYNVASGFTASIVELISLCEAATGRKIKTEYQRARGVDIAHVSPSNRTFLDSFAWRPRIDLAAGLARTWDWTRQASETRPRPVDGRAHGAATTSV
jgi:UDP-glucose 4-epimerase